MLIDYDEVKRQQTLENRSLDFADAGKVFTTGDGLFTVLDEREDYGEKRWQTMGPLNGDIVMIVWTQRKKARRIISMRKCNDREKRKYHETVDRSG
ncbi:BrnT family toxin [Brevundimonas sp.]|uniref:BrnT family toxin n=1 Tax=Brevundimonas sp. TaxID=1871086 RepID=UPI00289F5AA7|nr:BrnT family toxin [Brevundimonas sp.]